MKRGRVFGHIFEINSLTFKAYLLPGTDSLIQSHSAGVSKIARIGSFAVINSAGVRLIGVISSLNVTEPEKLFMLKTKTDFSEKQMIRTVTISLIGQFQHTGNGSFKFERGITFYPSLDEEVCVPTQEELDLIINESLGGGDKLVEIGESYSASDIKIKLNPVKLFSRHCSVVGSTGNGKSCTVTVLINEILKKQIKLPVFIFDVNGEYSWAFQNRDDIRIIKFSSPLDSTYEKTGKVISDSVKINYSSFSRKTWRTILKPSEKTQIPALNFAIDCLKYISTSLDKIVIPSTFPYEIPEVLNQNRSRIIAKFLCGDPAETAPDKLKQAHDTVQFLSHISARSLPILGGGIIPMKYLASLITDRWAIQPNRNGGYQFDAFRYQNVASLCDRILELCRDPLFESICETKSGGGISLPDTATIMSTGDGKKCKISIFDLASIPQEYLPVVADCLMEQQLSDALDGKFIDEPRLLVLDEAHHYLGKRYSQEGESNYLGTTPGDRISKEGRKFGLHMLISTQRPGELSPTIVAQIGTLISHALTNDGDRNIVNAFGNYNDRTILNELSVLPRREAIIIGHAISMPYRIKVSFLEDASRPKSKDPLEGKL